MAIKLLSLILIVLVSAFYLGSVDDRRLPPDPGRGNEWMRWSQETRNLLVYAYLVGYQEGSIDGCIIADELFAPGKRFRDPAETPAARCSARRKKFSKPFEFYPETITRFFEEYPEDSDVAARFILRKLYDGSLMTLEELHQQAQSGEIFH